MDACGNPRPVGRVIGLGWVGAVLTVLVFGLVKHAHSQAFGDHDQELGPAGFFTAWHEPGYDNPATNCTGCHGNGQGGLDGGLGPSCYTCHGSFWEFREVQYPGPAPPPGGPQNYPDFHTVDVGEIMPLSAGDVGWDCWYCHYSFYWGGTSDKVTFWHAPGHGTPYQSGCTQCHGPDLDGVNGFAVSCYWCHQAQWAGGGVPPDHKDTSRGSEFKGNFAWHRFGWDDPYSVFNRNPYSPDGCTRCHGPNLDDGFAPSCFGCHGPGGVGPPGDHTDVHDGVGHKPGALYPFANGCTACHGAQLEGGFGPSCLNCHGPSNTPGNHTVVLNGFAAHPPGLEDPFNSGCTQCHGPNLNDGAAVSCFVCHGPRWDPHDFSGEPWLPSGENHCYVCHLPPIFGQPGPAWNHEPSTSTFTVADGVGQPNGTSAKCLACHEGEPDGPAVEDYGGSTGGVYFVDGEEAFGTDLTQHHPVSFTYDTALAVDHGGLNDPATAPSGRTRSGTIAEDMLEAGQVQCTSCHDQHDNSKGNYLFETVEEDSCFICHKLHTTAPLTHHIPGRLDPWGFSRGTTFNCTLCHGENLEGNGEDVPACDDCHNDFAFPNAPPTGHHGGNRYKPYFDCAACHADPLTGVLTGNRFGTSYAPSCFQCHDDLWNVPGNDPPTVDAGGPYSGTVGHAVMFDASGTTDPEGDPLAYAWSFGDGSQALMPSHDPKTQHTFDASGIYHAALSVTDGVNPPDLVQFDVAIDAAPAQFPDTWNVTTGHPLPESFAITFEDHSGSLVGVKDDGGLAFGIEYVGVIYWMEVWMDLSGNAYWGTGDIFFGNIDREAGTMMGVVFDQEGGTFTFSGTKP